MRENGKKNDQHQDRTPTLERLQEVRDRPRQRPVGYSRGNDKGKDQTALITRLFKAVRRILSFMAELTPEQRKELLFELDQINQQVKPLVIKIRDMTDKLEEIMKNVRSYVLETDRSYYTMAQSTYLAEKSEWNPAEFDLNQLRKDQTRLRELFKRRSELEKQLRTTVR